MKKEEGTLSDLLFMSYLNKLYSYDKINFSANDDNYSKKINQFIEKYFTNLVIDENDLVDRYYLETLEYTVYKGVLDYRVNQNIFLSHLNGHYSRAFSASDALYISSLDIGKAIFNDKNNDDTALNKVLKLLHMKACQVYIEISTLVKNGFGTGAMARFRSIHETSIVLEYIIQKGENTAQAYLDYLIVADMKDEEILKKYYPESYKKNEKLVSKFRKNKENLVEKYDKEFVNLKNNNDYIWAYYTLEQKKGHRFGIQKLREEVKRKNDKFYYKLASNIIHASTKSVFSNISNPERYATSGGSNTGLSQPISLSSYELMVMNNLLLNAYIDNSDIIDKFKKLFMMKTNFMLCKEIEETYTLIEDNILDDFYETGNSHIY